MNVDVSEDGDVISGTASSSVTINANETNATLTVATDDDDADESNSVVTAEVESGTGYTVGSTSSASVIVEDNDETPQVTISAGTTPVTEGAAATFTISASPAPTSALTVTVKVSETEDVLSGTPASSVTINANAATATLTVATDDDDADESNSVVTAQLQAGTGYTVGATSSASVIVEDNDDPSTTIPPSTPQVTISSSTTPVTEGTAATFTISASPAPTSALTVTVKVSETEDVLSGTPASSVTINANAATATLTVSTDNDQADESNSVVTAQLQAGTGYTVGATSSASVTVEDNDDPPPVARVEVTPREVTLAALGNTATLTARVLDAQGNEISGEAVSWSSVSPEVATVDAAGVVTAVVNGRATVTASASGVSGEATVTVWQRAVSVAIDPGEVELTSVDETAELTLRAFDANGHEAPGGGDITGIFAWRSGNLNVATVSSVGGLTAEVRAIGAGTTTVTVTLDDGRLSAMATVTVVLPKVLQGEDNPVDETPQVTISAGTTPVTEGTAATFTITASSAPTSALTVNVDVSEDGDVISGTAPTTVTIDANKTSATLTVATDDDSADEAASVITAEVESGTGYTVGSSSSATVTVNDNDETPQVNPEVTISAGTSPVTEGTAATFTITASSAPTSALTVNVDVDVTYADHLTSGTPPSTVTINANATTATLTVATEDDDVIEINGQVIAEVQTGTGYTVGSSSSARVVIENNDHPTPVASVEIDPSSVEFTEVGATKTLTARILDSEGNETRATSWGWSSADEEVATVNDLIGTEVRGWVKAIGAGTTTITLSASGRGGTASGTATVTVTVSGRRVEISPGSLIFEALGETQTVTVKVLDENGDEDTGASWNFIGAFSTGGIGMERVDGGLEITANGTGIGNGQINSEGAQSAILIVKVYQKSASLELSPSSVDLTVGGTTTLSATIKDANGHEIGVDQGDGEGGRVVYWETSDSAVATADGVTKSEDGNTGGTATVTAVAAGTATITGRHSGDIVGTATVTVTSN